MSVLVGAVLVSCSNYSNRTQTRSGLKFRAFVSNPLHVTRSGVIPALDIVDATKDVLSLAGVSLSGALPDAGMMVLTPKKDRTLVVSPLSNRIAVVDNATESTAGAVSLPGATESLFVWTDNTSAFVAIPSAPVSGQADGGVGRIDISTGAITATIPVPGAHYLVPSPTGNQILIFSDNSDVVTLLFPALIGTGVQTNTQIPCSAVPAVACTVGGFDRPVWGVFSADGSTAYIMNCGPECSGSAAGVAVLSMSQNPPTVTATIPVPAATTGLLSGGTLFVAGTPPQPLGTDCQANLCGVLTLISGGTSQGSIPIVDGYHNQVAMATNGQLFIGSRKCTNIIGSGSSAPGRGCLSVLSTNTPTAIACGGTGGGPVFCSSQSGDVTAIEPIPNRNAVYVCEGGKLTIYDTRTDLPSQAIAQGRLQPQTTQVNIVGQAIDVKVVDF